MLSGTPTRLLQVHSRQSKGLNTCAFEHFFVTRPSVSVKL